MIVRSRVDTPTVKEILHQLANDSQERVEQYTKLLKMHPEGCMIGGILNNNVTVEELITAQTDATTALREAARTYDARTTITDEEE
jgi:hypothetical protein